jgi:hypothetical protein
MLENKREVIAFLQRCPNCGEKGRMREKGIDRRHAEPDSLGLGNQPGTTPFVNASAFTVGYLQVASGLPVIRP